MDVTSADDEHSHDEAIARSEHAASSNIHLGQAQPIAIARAAAYGAVLSAVVALMQGSAILGGFEVTLARVGYFKGGVSVTAYAGRSLLGLLLVVLAAAALGALAWSACALIWNKMVGLYRARPGVAVHQSPAGAGGDP